MKRILLLLVFCLSLPACVTTNQRVLDMGDETQLQKRSYQSRQMLVRATAQYGLRPIEDPAQYQSFFNSLGKSLFLEAQAVE